MTTQKFSADFKLLDPGQILKKEKFLHNEISFINDFVDFTH